MKKLLILSLILGSLSFVVPQANAASAAASNMADPQIRVQIGGRNRNRGVRSAVRTRIVRRWNGTYRETYRVSVFRGRTQEQLISRVRVRG